MAYASVLAAMSDPTRRAVLEMLREGPRSVAEIARRLPVSRPAVSQHLKVLKQADLVFERRDGTRRLYGVDAAGLETLRAYLESFWADALSEFKSAADGGDRGETR